MTTELTHASLALFLTLARDSMDWNGVPLFEGSKRQCGNLSDLKTKGLLSTQQDEENRLCHWVMFSESGRQLAAQHGINIPDN